MIWGVLASELEDHLDTLWPLLKTCAETSTGRWTAEQLMAALEQQDKQLWVAGPWKAIVLTSVGPDHVTIEFCAGKDRLEWMREMDAVICAWAKHMGKDRVFAKVRLGWTRAVPDGYRELAREFVREL